MISPASLSAFSASATQSMPSLRTAGVGWANAARDAAQTAPANPAGARLPLPGAPPGQRLPRGSLLNLSV